MPSFEIFVPAADSEGFDVTARLTAPSWTEALRVGLARMHDATDVRHVICDIRDDGVDVTDPKSGRVFKIVETREAAASVAIADEDTAPSPATQTALPLSPAYAPMGAVKPMLRPPPEPVEPGYVATIEPRSEPAAVQRAHAERSAVQRTHSEPAAVQRAHAERAAVQRAHSEPAAVQQARVEPVAVESAPIRPARTAPIDRAHVPQAAATAKSRVAKAAEAPTSRIDELLGDMFIAASGVFQHTSIKGAADFIIDLALKAVPAEGGRVLVSSINAHDLYPAAARGPKAEIGTNIRIPMGEGIVGVAAQEGVAIAVSGNELCSPAQRDGRVYGALQLLNKKGGAFTADEISILDYLASQFAEYVITTGQTDS